MAASRPGWEGSLLHAPTQERQTPFPPPVANLSFNQAPMIVAAQSNLLENGFLCKESSHSSIADVRFVDQVRNIMTEKGISFGDIVQAGINTFTATSPPQVHTIMDVFTLQDTQWPVPPFAENTSFKECLEADHLNTTTSSSIYPFFADPRKNYIVLCTDSVRLACTANLYAIGITPKWDCHTKGSCFHQQDRSIGSEAFRIHYSTKFSHIKADLQPSVSQITVQHPIYIDALPLPSFRERIIALRVVEPKVFDEKELWSDIINDGLVCWGARSPIGSGTPWDKRSWEARGWFLKKWWMLTGGADGEMGSHSRWWCEVRGESFEDLGI